jgi:Terpene cyclase DEP1
MLKNWTPLAIVYLVLAIAGLVGTWSWNIVAIIELRDFVGDWVNSGPAVSSLTVDLLVAAVAGSILIIVEGRRVGMKWVWVLLPLSALTAFAFTFPLFLALRERRLAARRAQSSPGGS